MHLVSFERLTPRGRPRGKHRRPSLDSQAPDDHRLGDAGMGMEALEPLRPGSQRLGAVLQLGPRAGDVVDLNQSLAIKLAFDDVGAPEAEADSLVPANMLQFLRCAPRSLAAAASALAFASESVSRFDAPDFLRTGAIEAADRIRVCAPIARPGKVFGVLGNYASPAKAPDPIFYLKAPTSVVGPNDEIALPDPAAEVHAAGALAVVIGARAKEVGTEPALRCIAGYSLAHDVRWNYQPDPTQIGRSCDTFCPMGPTLVTADDVRDPQSLSVRSSISGDAPLTATTKEMRWSVPELVSRLSQRVTLEPGDVVLTGSPGEREPHRALRDGDVLEFEIESLGRLISYVRGKRG